jgi:ABC-type transporter Mla subunit MlaD
MSENERIVTIVKEEPNAENCQNNLEIEDFDNLNENNVQEPPQPMEKPDKPKEEINVDLSDTESDAETTMDTLTQETEEFDVTRENLYQILSAVLETQNGDNLTEMISNLNDSVKDASEKQDIQYENLNKTLRKMNEHLVSHNKYMEKMANLFERFVAGQEEEIIEESRNEKNAQGNVASSE